MRTSLSPETVRDSGSSRLIDNTKDVETRNCTGILCGLTLQVVKVLEVGLDLLIIMLAADETVALHVEGTNKAE
jgi:hypothetical protein